MSCGHRSRAFSVSGLGMISVPVAQEYWRLARVLCGAGPASAPKCCLSESSAPRR